MQKQTSFLEALSNLAKGLLPLRGRFLLDSKSCGDNEGFRPEQRARKQVSAGIALAELGLWKTAALRWKKAIELDPMSSDACNNLAVAYEMEGKDSLASSQYERALAIKARHVYILQNYEIHRATVEHRARVDPT